MTVSVEAMGEVEGPGGRWEGRRRNRQRSGVDGGDGGDGISPEDGIGRGVSPLRRLLIGISLE